MAFEQLFFKPQSELELIKVLSALVQSRFEELRGRFFFLKVDLVNAEQSQIVWEEEFPNTAVMKDFFYDSKNERSLIGIRFEEDRFEAVMSGFCVSARFKIFPDRMVMEKYPYIHECDPKREAEPMIPRELWEGGFGDLTRQLQDRLGKKAV